MYRDVQVIKGLMDFADMRDFSRVWKEARETTISVHPFEKRVSGKLSDPSGKYLPKKKTALAGLPKHASYGIEKVQRLKSSVHPSLRPSWQQGIDPDVAPNLAAMGVNLVGRLQVVLRGQRCHLQAEAACAQRLVGIVLAPEHI